MYQGIEYQSSHFPFFVILSLFTIKASYEFLFLRVARATSILYTVNCTLYFVHCTLYTVYMYAQCTMRAICILCLCIFAGVRIRLDYIYHFSGLLYELISMYMLSSWISFSNTVTTSIWLWRYKYIALLVSWCIIYTEIFISLALFFHYSAPSLSFTISHHSFGVVYI